MGLCALFVVVVVCVHVVLSVNSDSGGWGEAPFRPPFGSWKENQKTVQRWDPSEITMRNAQKQERQTSTSNVSKHFLPKQEESKLSGLLEDCRGWRSNTWRGRMQRRGNGGACACV